MSDAAFAERLAAIVGARHVIGPDGDLAPYVTDWRERYHGHAVAAVKPGSTAEVSAVVRLAAGHGVTVVLQGGNTGLCGGAAPMQPGRNLVVRLDRMRAIRAVSPLANTVTVEAGCVLAEIQAAADASDRYFPLSLGAEGSCQIGGNIGTNAGGTAVLRYGPVRELVLARAVADGADREARAGLALASLYGGFCLGPVNTTAGHAVAYPLGTRHHVAHGLACAAIFPHTLGFNAAAVPEKTARVLEALGAPPAPGAGAVLEHAYRFCADLGVEMRLSRLGVPEDDLDRMAEEAHAIRRLLDNNPRPMSRADIAALYRAAY